MTVKLDSLVSTLDGVGPKAVEQLKKLRVHTIFHLLLHLPYRYEDRTHCTPLAKVRAGTHVLVEGCITDTQIQGRRRTLAIRVEDRTGSITLRYFHYSRNQHLRLKLGDRLRCYGEVRFGPTGFELAHPEIEITDEENLYPLSTTLTPVYPTVSGLNQKRLRTLTQSALIVLQNLNAEEIPELLPSSVIETYTFPDLSTALLYLHGPPADTATASLALGTHPAQRRLIFEELLAHQLSRRKARAYLHALRAPAMADPARLTEQFIAALPFRLTAAQTRVTEEILRDMAQPQPMLRLLLGDVGAGKTVVAAIAALHAIANGYQAALMVPTEILAEQHHRTLTTWFDPLQIKVFYLSSKHRNRAKAKHDSHDESMPSLTIGTHTLFQTAVTFHKLGLVIIDEQHRFGVQQRLALREKGRGEQFIPHQLVMSATPIPRTLAMALCADLDLSILDELPPSRQPVRTIALPNNRRDEVLARIAALCRQGRQAFWVCTLIELSEALQCQAATRVAEEIASELPDVRVGLVHGRLSTAEKDEVMAAFKAGKLDLLVATTVVEVGVDVPNASFMIIENAERLGLAQLHQLRGRVGRGIQQSDCVLLYQPPLAETARARLAVMRESNDGFDIAERDLSIRGPGEMLGTRQAGAPRLRIADLARDVDLLPTITETVTQLLDEANLDKVHALTQRWFGDTLDYETI